MFCYSSTEGQYIEKCCHPVLHHACSFPCVVSIDPHLFLKAPWPSICFYYLLGANNSVLESSKMHLNEKQVKNKSGH